MKRYDESRDERLADSDHWLVRPENIRLMWIIGCVILALTVLADFFVTHHPYFGIDGTIGFGAWYGFLSCVGLVLFSKGLGLFLKRDDDYYDD